MVSSGHHSPAIRRSFPSTDALRLSDFADPPTAASRTSYSDIGGLDSQHAVLSSGILRLPPEIHLVIAQYLSGKSIHAMILMLSCPAIQRMSPSGRTLAVYVGKAGKLGKCGKMLMRTLALPEYPLHALNLLADVCPKAELTNLNDDACWPLCVPDERSVAVRYADTNPRWLVGLFGEHLTTLELARPFPHVSPEIFSNPINMAAAVGECSHPVNPCQSCTFQCFFAVNPCGNYSAAMRCGFTLGFGRFAKCKTQMNSTCSVFKEYITNVFPQEMLLRFKRCSISWAGRMPGPAHQTLDSVNKAQILINGPNPMNWTKPMDPAPSTGATASRRRNWRFTDH